MRQVQLAVLFSLGWVFIYADRTVLYPMLSLIAEGFNLSNAQASAITSTYFFTYIFMQIPAGILGDRVGLKYILGIPMILAGLSLTFLGVASLNYFLVLLFIGIHGFVAGMYYANVYGATMNLVTENHRSMYTAIINGGMSVGLILGLLIAGPLYYWTQDWRYPFLILSVPTAALGFYYLYYFNSTSLKKTDFSSVYLLFQNRNIVLIWIVVACLAYGYWMVLTWGPTFFEAERGLGLTMAGLYTAIPAVAALPSSLILARVSRKLGKKRIVIVFSFLCSLAVFIIVYAQSSLALIVALVAYGVCGKLALDPILISWYGEHALATNPGSMSSAMGLLNFSAMFTAVVAPVVCGWVRDWTNSLEGAFYSGAFIVLVGCLTAFLVEGTVKQACDGL